MVKIDHVILVYQLLTCKIVQLWTLIFVSWFNHGRVFVKFKPLNQMNFIELLLQRKLPFIRVHTLKLFNLAGFLAHVQQFSSLLDKFEVWVSCEAVCDIFEQVLPDLLNTGFIIIEIGLRS